MNGTEDNLIVGGVVEVMSHGNNQSSIVWTGDKYSCHVLNRVGIQDPPYLGRVNGHITIMWSNAITRFAQ